MRGNLCSWENYWNAPPAVTHIASTAFIKTPSRAIHIFQDARKKAAFFSFLCVYARIFFITRERLPYLRTCSRFSLSENFLISSNKFQFISPVKMLLKIVICRPLCKRFSCTYSLHVYVWLYLAENVLHGEAFNTVPLTTTSDWQCRFRVKKNF